MGTHGSRPEVGGRTGGTAPTARFSGPLCSSGASSIASKSTHSGEYTTLRASVSSRHDRRGATDHDAANISLRREAYEREQSSNYFSNDYKRQLSQRKAALRYEKEQRNARPPPPPQARSHGSGITAYLSKEDIARMAETPAEACASDGPLPVTVHRGTAPSVLSETSVRTVAHRPILRHSNNVGGGGGVATAVRRRPAQAGAPPRRLRWSDDVAVGREGRQREGGPVGFFPIFAYDTSHTASSSHWQYADDGGGGGGGCDNTAF